MRGRILVVEDDAIIRLDLANILREEGYDVAVSSNGESALAILSDDREFGLILLDLMMPVMDGWTMRKELLDDPHLSKIPVVILSAASDPKREISALEPAAVLGKPFGLDSLLATVAAHCRNPSNA